MTRPEATSWTPDPRPWGWGDLAALGLWTAALLIIFRDAALLKGALFYFDVTEINYPYREFFARELRAGRFSRWMPDLYCGMALYSESQAGYLHPLKYLLYPWMATWKAFNLDTLLSIWIAGSGTYGWLRRHVNPAGALTAAAVFGLGGFAWAHLIHTSMINALASVPLAFWALEAAWDGGKVRPVVLGALALACQVFAGHLQDVILTGSALGVYALHRAATATNRVNRRFVLASSALMVVLAIAISAVQWIPSKELIDRSPRDHGLAWDEMTYGSWHPELIPTLLVREAYGTRARDTDWMDGFYPYHEMDTYLGVVGLFLAAVGASACRDRWVAFWPILAGLGLLLMLGRFTFLMDYLNRVPIVGSGRIPVRYHLWVSVSAAALAAVGVDRLSRPGFVTIRGGVGLIAALLVVSIPILAYVYLPAWTEATRWTARGHVEKFGWLGREAATAVLRTTLLGLGAIFLAARLRRSGSSGLRSRMAFAFPLLALADLAGAHWHDVPTVDPRFWTGTPGSVAALRKEPTLIRMYGEANFASGEPGYASRPVDFFRVRDGLAWSLPVVWNLQATAGITPIVPHRWLRFIENSGRSRHDIEGMSHLLSATPAVDRLGPDVYPAGLAYFHRNPTVLPRARFLGEPVYAQDERDATRALARLGKAVRERIVVEDPDRPIPANLKAVGRVKILRDEPEAVEVEVIAETPGYLFLADSFDPGWSAKLNGKPAPIRPAQVAFRAVFVPAGSHEVSFSYRPAGFATGLAVSCVGVVLAVAGLVWPRRFLATDSPHRPLNWPRWWPWGLLAAMALIVATSIPIRVHVPIARQAGKAEWISRWSDSFHRFTWGAGIEAIKPPKPPLD